LERRPDWKGVEGCTECQHLGLEEEEDSINIDDGKGVVREEGRP
jgi:hypothetical protein